MVHRHASVGPTPRGAPLRALALLALAAAMAWAIVGKVAGEVFMDRRITQRIGVAEGLPDQLAFSLAIGPDGALYIGTREGLARFNGTELDSELFRRSLPGSAADTVFDRSGRIWVSGRRAVQWFPDPPTPPLPSGRWLERGDRPMLTADGLGHIWISSMDGLMCHDGRTVHQVPADANWRGPLRLCVFPAAKGGIYTAGDDGCIGHFALSGVTRRTPPPPGWPGPNPELWAVAEDPHERLWITWTAGGKAALFVWMDEQWIDASGALAKGTWPRMFAVGQDGTFFMGTEQGGVTEFGDDPLVFSRHMVSPRNPILSIVTDRIGTWWVGTAKGGVFKLPRARGVALASSPPELCRALGLDPNGRLMVGSVGSGLMEEKDNRLVPSPFRKGIEDMHIVNAMLSTEDGLWVGGQGDLKCLKDGQWRSIAGMTEAIGQESVMALAAAPDGSVWACGSAGLILHVDVKEQQWRRIDADVGMGWIYDAKICGTKLWMIVGSALVELDTERPDQPVRRWNDVAEPKCLLVDALQRVFVSTRDNGIAVIAGGHIKTLDSRNGLNTKLANQMVMDRRGNLWLGTTDGIVGLLQDDFSQALKDPLHLLVPQFRGISTGLKCAHCPWSGSSPALCLPDGRLAFTTIEGVTILDPSERLPKIPPPNVHVQQVEIDGESQPVERGTPLSIVGPKLVRLSFESVLLESPVPPVFRWRLDPEAMDWARVDGGRSIAIVKPTAGFHVFRLQARDADGHWHDAAPLRFEILPHWWETTVFRGTLGVLGFGLPVLTLHLFHRARERRRRLLEAATRKIHAERSRISRDLHDELGNRLSELQLLAERAETVPVAGGQNARQRLKGRTVEAIASLDQLVWLLNPRHDTWASLARMIEREGSDYLEMASIATEFVPPSTGASQPPDPPLRRAVLLAHREMLHNVVQHSGATHATVRLTVERGTVTLEVVDNGRGFDVDAALAEGRGLAGLRQRAAEFHGSFTAVSHDGHSSVKVGFSSASHASATLSL